MKTVLITGGSEGIGFALAKCFAAEGYEVLLAARDPEKLKKAKAFLESRYHVRAGIFCCDLSDPSEAERLHDMTNDRNIDVLVNNAGCGYTGRLWDISGKKEKEMIQLNISAVTILMRLFLKDMTRRRKGIILNVASTGAFQPGPYTALYYASKAYVVSISRAAAAEAAPYGVKVSCLCPGPVNTAFYDKAGGRTPFYAMDADACASYAFRRLGKEIIVPGLLSRAALRMPEPVRIRFVERKKRGEIKKIIPQEDLAEQRADAVGQTCHDDRCQEDTQQDRK